MNGLTSKTCIHRLRFKFDKEEVNASSWPKILSHYPSAPSPAPGTARSSGLTSFEATAESAEPAGSSKAGDSSGTSTHKIELGQLSEEQTYEQSGWDFHVAPYFWFLSIDGDLTVKGQESDVDVGFDKIWDELNIAAMLEFEARKGRWGLYGGNREPHKRR
jgi:hypothetical protein